MLKKFYITLAIIFLLGLGNNYSFAQNMDKPNPNGTISVSGYYSEDFPPDTATISLSVVTESNTATEAGKLNGQKSNAVINKINSLINKTKGDSVKTTSYSISPVYDYNQTKKTNQIIGYNATNQIQITTKQINNTGSIIDDIVENGVNEVNNISFSIASTNDYYQKIIIFAADKAKNEATILAQALGVKITGIKQASYSSDANTYQPLYRRMVGMSTMPAQQTPIEPGNVKISGTVNIEFYIDK